MTDYNSLNSILRSLTEDVPHLISNLANASSLIFNTLNDLNWAGFYILENSKLVLGPFQGKPACIEIEIGKGVCGTAVAENKTQRIDNVHLFPGHIACDGASNSEIVIPIHKGKDIFGVLDIDSPIFERFSEDDQIGLEKFVSIIEEIL